MSKISGCFYTSTLKPDSEQTAARCGTHFFGDGLLEGILSFKNHFGLTNLNVMQCWIVWTSAATA